MEKNVANKVVEDVVSQFIQGTESEILTMNDWNLELGNGSDILDMILKLSNADYDFSRISKKVHKESITEIFSS
jgi:hypothetical protein